MKVPIGRINHWFNFRKILERKGVCLQECQINGKCSYPHCWCNWDEEILKQEGEKDEHI